VTFVRGYPAAQIFSPPGAQFVCLEPMAAPTNVLRSGDGLRRVAGRRVHRRVPHRRHERMNPADVAVARFSTGT
jgi:hypothetical protein